MSFHVCLQMTFPLPIHSGEAEAHRKKSVTIMQINKGPYLFNLASLFLGNRVILAR